MTYSDSTIDVTMDVTSSFDMTDSVEVLYYKSDFTAAISTEKLDCALANSSVCTVTLTDTDIPEDPLFNILVVRLPTAGGPESLAFPFEGKFRR